MEIPVREPSDFVEKGLVSSVSRPGLTERDDERQELRVRCVGPPEDRGQLNNGYWAGLPFVGCLPSMKMMRALGKPSFFSSGPGA
jgi:hypothetical protein